MTAVRALDRSECLALLARCSFGRVAVSMEALPAILPVTYRLVGEEVVFRTSPGTKLSAATAGTIVAFEIDEVDPMDHGGWSVLVVGLARVVSDPEEVARLERAGVPRWAPGADERYVAIDVARVSGRELGTRQTTAVPPSGPGSISS